jgi:hypothetical protein
MLAHHAIVIASGMTPFSGNVAYAERFPSERAPSGTATHRKERGHNLLRFRQDGPRPSGTGLDQLAGERRQQAALTVRHLEEVLLLKLAAGEQVQDE